MFRGWGWLGGCEVDGLAVISFDQLNTFDEYKYGPVWEQALDETWSRMRVVIAAGRLPIPRGDVLAWAAQTERPPRDRRLFSERVEQIAAIFDELNRTLSPTQRR